MIDPTSRTGSGLAALLAPRQQRDIAGAISADTASSAIARSSAAGVTSEVRGIARDMAANPPVDSSKVAALRSAIASGAYHVDAGRLADAMIGSVSSATPG